MRVEQLWLKRVTEASEAVTKARGTARVAAQRLKAVAHAHRPAAKVLERKLKQLQSMLEGQRLTVPEYEGFRGFLEGMSQAMASEQEQLAELELKLKRLRKAIQGRATKALAVPRKERKSRRKAQHGKKVKERDQDAKLYERQRSLMVRLNQFAVELGPPRGNALWKLASSVIDNAYEFIKPGVVEWKITSLRIEEPASSWLLELRDIVAEREKIRLKALHG